jgi:quercetin dioxygenase-like cupin family protein
MKIIKNLRASGLVPIGNGSGGRGMTARTGVFISVGVAAVLTALVGAALATPPSSIVSGTVVARASFVEPVDVKFKIGEGRQEVIQAPELQETVIQQIIIGPGGSTGWHSHPGPVVVLIKAGELTFYSSEDPTCTPRTYSAGQAFVDRGQGHVHLARNLSSQNLELWATYFDVPPGGPFRLDAADPGNCGF